MIETTRLLEEVKALYELEPSLKDIYVEGSMDREMIKWFFERIGGKVHVYNIDILKVPNSLFANANMSRNSNHNKVIVLSEELSRHFKRKKVRVKCICDMDYDRYLNKLRGNNILEYTDYTAMEMYFFSISYIDKFVNLVLNRLPVATSLLMENMKEILQRFFLIRLTNEHLKWNMQLLDFRRYLSWNEGVVVFEEDRYIKNCLTNNSRMRERETFISVMGDYWKKFDSDVRHNIRGHDFTWLFFWIVKKFKKHSAGYRDAKVFERGLCGCLELDFIKDEGLFKKLARFFGD